MSFKRLLLSQMPTAVVISLWSQVMKPCTSAYISPLTLRSSGIIVTLPGPVISWSKVIKPDTSEKCQKQNSVPQGFKKRVCAFPSPLIESLGENKRLPVKWALFAYPFLLLKLKTLRCPIFSVPRLAKGVAFFKIQIRNHHPRRTKSKQKISQWNQDFGFSTFPHFIASLCFQILFLASSVSTLPA